MKIVLYSIFLSVLLSFARVNAQERFMYQGKEVTKPYFDAVNTAREAAPLMKPGTYAEAEVLLKKAMEVASDDPDICQNYALALLKNGKAKESVAYYEKASVLNPNSESCWIGWSSAYGALGQLDDSLRVCDEFLKRFPKSSLYAQMKNQAETIRKEVSRLKKANAGASKESDDYLAEASPSGEVHRWGKARMPLAVYIEPGDAVPNWRASYDGIMRQAFRDWQDASEGLLAFKFVDSASEASIKCVWTNDLRKLKNPQELGEADTTWAENGELLKATVKMLTISPINPETELTETKVRQTSLHEIGHALGIHGHSSNPKDAMYFASLANEAPCLSQRDAKTIQLIYAGYKPKD